MFAAGGLLWANTSERLETVSGGPSAEAFEETSESRPGDPIFKCYGWPVTAASQHVGAVVADGQPAFYTISNPMKFVRAGIGCDSAAGLFVLLAVWIFCECWIGARSKSRGRGA